MFAFAVHWRRRTLPLGLQVPSEKVFGVGLEGPVIPSKEVLGAPRVLLFPKKPPSKPAQDHELRHGRVALVAGGLGVAASRGASDAWQDGPSCSSHRGELEIAMWSA